MADTTSTATPTPQTYLERISVGKEAKAAQELADAAEESSIQLDSDIMAAKKEQRNASRDLDSAKNAIPLDSADVIDAARSLKQANEDLTELLALKDELFSTPAAS